MSLDDVLALENRKYQELLTTERQARAHVEPPSRWRTFGKTCPRTFPEIPYIAVSESRSGHGCDCWDCVEIRTARQLKVADAALLASERAREGSEEEVARLNELVTKLRWQQLGADVLP